MSFATKELDTLNERIPTPQRDCNARAAEVRSPAVGKGVDRRWISTFALAIVVVGGVLPRLNHAGKSLWTGEAWVANSVLSDSLAQMFHYDAWLQTTPPLFLLLVRESVHVFGTLRVSGSAVPVVSSSACLVGMAQSFNTSDAVCGIVYLAARSLSTRGCLSEGSETVLGRLSSELFHISFELIVSSVTQRKSLLVAHFGTCFRALSFLPAVLMHSLVFWVLLPAQTATTDGQTLAPRVRFLRLVPAAGLVALISALNYWFFVRPNTAPQLTAFWAEGYPTIGSVKVLVHFYPKYFLGMSVSYYLPVRLERQLWNSSRRPATCHCSMISISCLSALWVAGPILRSRLRYRNVLLFVPSKSQR